MRELTFNMFKAQNTKSGTKCLTVRMQDLKQYGSLDKSDSYLIQTYATGYRIAKDNVDYSKWNGAIFIDIDSKKYKRDGNILFFGQLDRFNKFVPDPEKEDTFNLFYISMLDSINAICDNLAFAQQSASRYSFHIVYWFDCERTEDNFKKAEKYAYNTTIEAARRLGKDFSDIIEFNGVLDSCTQSIGQGIYVTPYDIHMYDCNGTCFLDDVVVEEEELSHNEMEFSSNAYKIAKHFTPLPDYEYRTRWKLLWIIANYLSFDAAKCREIWKSIAQLVSENRKEYRGPKGIADLMSQFERDLKSSVGKKYNFNTQLVEWSKKNLGFKIDIVRKFIPRDITKGTYNKEYVIDENERVSKVIKEIVDLPSTIVHIDSGCGDGKTYSAKFLSEHKNQDDVDALMSYDTFRELYGYRICFITPMKSINKDNFEDESRWAIVDGDHKFEDNGITSVCTTWDSFCFKEMWNWHFDVVMIDEIHTLYMYEYRMRAIASLKKAIRILEAKGTKTLLFTGTPSYELQEFNVYKVKIVRERPKVKCSIIFYNDTYNGWMYENIREWLKAPNHKAVVFKDKNNWLAEESFLNRGFSDIELYNSKSLDAVERISKEHSLKHKITLVSVYGQAGINIYADAGDRVRIYVLDNSALGIVQYANRIRNKETIDRVYVPYKMSDMTSNVVRVDDVVDFDDAERRVELLNDNFTFRYDDPFDMYADLGSGKYADRELMMKISYGIPKECLNVSYDGKFSLVRDVYESYDIIVKNKRYEKQMQVIWNRLVHNYFDVEIEYIDCKADRISSKFAARKFAGQILRLANSKYSDIVRLDSKGKHWLDTKDDYMHKIMTGTLSSDICTVLDWFAQDGDEAYVKDRFKDFVNDLVETKGTVAKVDFKVAADTIKILKKIDSCGDSFYLNMLMSEEWGLNKTVAYYVGTLKFDEKDFDVVVKESVALFTKVNRCLQEYTDMFEVHKCELRSDMMKKSDLEVAKRVLTVLEGNRKRGKQCRIEFEGKVYSSVSEAARMTGKSRPTIMKNCKYLE